MSTHYSVGGCGKLKIQSTPTEVLSSIPAIKVDEPIPPALSFPLGCPSDPRAIPPSPTLSTQSSVYFMASTALQDNKPEGGMASPALTSPADPFLSSAPHPSNVTKINTDDGTIADQSDDQGIEARDDLPLFPRLNRGRINPFSSILKSPRIPNDDRVTL